MTLSPRFTESIESLKLKFSKSVDELAWIQHLAITTREFPYPHFFEPKSWLFIEKEKEARFEISADLLAAWICHMSHSTRRRMEVYEDEVLDALSKDRFLVASTLARCHMEASAWGIYALEELSKASDSSIWSKLEILIPKMLNGSAVFAEREHLAQSEVDPLWLKPKSVMEAIDAMGQYFATCNAETPKESPRILYAVLSDYAHPSMLGARCLFQAREAKEGNGWTIFYGMPEPSDADDSAFVLRALLLSMRLGHSAAMMLRLGTIEDRDDGVFYLKPPLSVGAGVWEHIINGRPESQKH